jgi:hypothetical protein
MRAPAQLKVALLVSAFFLPVISFADNLSFREIEDKIREYRTWLDLVGSNGSRLWMQLDSSKRPHRLYVGEGFAIANFEDKETFIEIFSRFLAGHPDKNMLIDIFDHSTGKLIGEYGFGGFKLFKN